MFPKTVFSSDLTTFSVAHAIYSYWYTLQGRVHLMQAGTPGRYRLWMGQKIFTHTLTLQKTHLKPMGAPIPVSYTTYDSAMARDITWALPSCIGNLNRPLSTPYDTIRMTW